MKIKINRNPDIIDYKAIQELPEYYKFQSKNIENDEITEWINEVIKNLLQGKSGDNYDVSSGNTFVHGTRYEISDNPNDDYIEIIIAKNYETLDLGVKDLEILR